MPETMERRFETAPDYRAELRLEQRKEGEPKTLVGYPAKFNTVSRDLWGFKETILPGAFKRTLAEGADVRALVNHNPDMVLGRTRSGTLRLKEDAVGLRMEVDTPDTQASRDIVTTIGRGDMDQGSFRFRTRTDNWRMLDGLVIRELIEVDLIDVSVVTFPAYEDTTVTARAASFPLALINLAPLPGLLVRIEHGLETLEQDRVYLTGLIGELGKVMDKLPKPARPALDRARRRLRLVDVPRT